VGDDEEGGAGLAPTLEEQVEDGCARRRVEIAGGLVGEDQLGLGGGGAGDGDALLLAARKLRRIMSEAMAEAYGLQLGGGGRKGIGLTGKLQRDRDIFVRGHRGKEVESLEDDADMTLAGAGEAVLIQRHEIGAGNADRARGGPLKAGKHRHQGGFAGAGGAEQRNAFAFRDFKADPAEDVDAGGRGAECQGDILGVDHVGAVHEEEGNPMRLRLPYGVLRLFVHLGLMMGIGSAAQAQERDVHILAFGDSLTAGYGLPLDQGFVPQLEDVLRRNGVRAHVINAGVSGNTTANGRARIKWTLDGLKVKPDLAIVALGANDMLRGYPPSQTREDLDFILDEFRKRDIKVLVAGMLAPPNLGTRYMAEYNSIFPDLARKYNAPLYPFFLAGVAGIPALNLPDRVHPNFQGIKRMVSGITPTVLKALGAG
jgi:acyl-CoA thioesterase I